MQAGKGWYVLELPDILYNFSLYDNVLYNNESKKHTKGKTKRK